MNTMPINTPMPITTPMRMNMGYNMHNTMPLTYIPFDNFQSKHYYNYNDYFDPRVDNRQQNSYMTNQREPVKESQQQYVPRSLNQIPSSNNIRQEVIEEPRQAHNGGFNREEPDVETIHNKKLYYKTILKQQIDEKRQRDEMRKKQDEEMDKLEEMKYNEYL